jgi:hypothetical protein
MGNNFCYRKTGKNKERTKGIMKEIKAMEGRNERIYDMI